MVDRFFMPASRDRTPVRETADPFYANFIGLGWCRSEKGNFSSGKKL
jgi:hypothetical protein